MLRKSIDALTSQDVEQLVLDGIPEGRQLDYKAELPGGSDGQRKEFAADITSFANAAGGFIVYGITEKRDASGKNTGIPQAVAGLPGTNTDEAIRRLESMARGNIDPVVPGLRSKAFDFPGGPVIVIHIPQSWSAPHMVAVGDDSRFYTRSSMNKQPMDVREIRSAFSLSAEMPERIRRFRDGRLSRIMSDETPVPLSSSDRLVLHIVPFTAVSLNTQIDLASWAVQPPRPLAHGGGWNHRYNADGFVTMSGANSGPQRSYLQIFRTGALEAVRVLNAKAPNGRLSIFPWHIEADIIPTLEEYFKRYKLAAFEVPMSIIITLLSIKGARLPNSSNYHMPDDGFERGFERDTLLLPDVLLEDYSVSLPQLLRPAFDAMWQAFGVPGSCCYDQDGTWQGQGFRW